MAKLMLICGLLLTLGCGLDSSLTALSAEEEAEMAAFQALASPHRLTVAGPTEPGRPLRLCLTYVDRATGKPLAEQVVKVYHTDHEGNYQPEDPADESTARLRGEARTDEAGRLLLQTILPGDYNGSTHTRHIHTQVMGAQPETYDIHFRPYTTPMGKNFIQGSDQHFLADLRLGTDSLLAGFVTLGVKNPALASAPLPPCEWCGAMDAPENLRWAATLAGPKEPGKRLVLQGTVYEADRKTPAPGVLVYAYHTNAEGVYPKRGDETGNGRRHGYLRGWVRTDARGRYRFETIRPAPYPSLGEPAHVHLSLSREAVPEFWVHVTWFAGDALISPQDRLELGQGDRFSPIVALEWQPEGSWRGERDLLFDPKDLQ